MSLRRLDPDLARTRDGRNVDEKLGALAGEGAQQQVKARRIDSAFPVQRSPTHVRASEAGAPRAAADYYGQPMLKEPVWTWMIPAYFFIGGLSGATSAFGGALQVCGGRAARRLEHQCRWIGACGDAAGAALLVADLGRPSRFMNMMRVLRPTSPMNLGTWVLAGSAACNGASALLSLAPGGALERLGDGASLGAAVLGLPLAGYTAVLLASTAVPVWQHGRRALPLLFTASAASSAGAAMQLLPGNPEGVHRGIRALVLAGLTAELLAGALLEREIRSVCVDGHGADPVSRPLKEGLSGALWKASKLLAIGALAATLLPPSRRSRRAAGGLGLGAGLVMRFAIFHAGKKSARDPQASFQAQRAGHGAAELRHPPRSFPLPVFS